MIGLQSEPNPQQFEIPSVFFKSQLQQAVWAKDLLSMVYKGDSKRRVLTLIIHRTSSKRSALSTRHCRCRYPGSTKVRVSSCNMLFKSSSKSPPKAWPPSSGQCGEEGGHSSRQTAERLTKSRTLPKGSGLGSGVPNASSLASQHSKSSMWTAENHKRVHCCMVPMAQPNCDLVGFPSNVFLLSSGWLPKNCVYQARIKFAQFWSKQNDLC